MKHFLALILLAVLATPSSHAQSPRDLLQQGIRLEEVDGDLERAIALYRRVADDRSADAQTAATALLHLGNAYEVLGRTEARAAYERILRDYGGVNEAATQARAGLARLVSQVQPPAPTGASSAVRTVATRFDLTQIGDANISPDGRLIATTLPRDSIDTGRYVGLVDVETGRITVIRSAPSPKEGNDLHPLFSPDGRTVALSTYNGRQEGYALILYDIETSRLRKLLSRPEDDPRWSVMPVAWAPGGDSVLVHIMTRSGDSRVMSFHMLSANTGQARRVAEVDSAPVLGSCLSPDGRWLWGSIYREEDRGRFLGRLDLYTGKATTFNRAGINELVMGCPPGTRTLTFSSDRLGDMSLWKVDYDEEGVLGEPVRIRALQDGTRSLGFDRAGRLYMVSRESAGGFVFELDAQGRAAATKPQRLPQATFAVGWNIDGSRFASASAHALFVRNEQTDRVREIRFPHGWYGESPIAWDESGTRLLLPTPLYEDYRPAYWVDAETGALVDSVETGYTRAWLDRTDELVMLDYPGLTQSAPDAEGCIVLRNRNTGNERKLFCALGCGWVDVYPSPDESTIAVFAYDNERGPHVRVIDVSSGASTVLGNGFARSMAWLPDGSALVVGLVEQLEPEGPPTRLLRYDPATGSMADWSPAPMTWSGVGLAFHPSGLRFAASGVPLGGQPELQVLEGFNLGN